MESLLVVVVCVCLASPALSLPQAVDTRSEQFDQEARGAGPLDQQLLKRSSSDQPFESSDLASPSLLDDSSMRATEMKEQAEEQSKVLPELPSDKLDLPEDTKAEAADTVRAKKSTTMRDAQYPHPPHTTTVCIQVRANHEPNSVVCGPPLADKGDSPSNDPKARFAYRTTNDYYPHSYDQAPSPYMISPIQAGPFRASPQGIPEGIPVQKANKSPIINQGPSNMSPKAALRGALPVSMFPMRRSEEEPASPKIGDATLPQSGGPVRINPQGSLSPPPNSVIIHKQYYPLYPPGHLNPAGPSSMRLTCAPETTFIPYLRSAPPPLNYIPLEERTVINPIAPRMAEVPQYLDEQPYYLDTQARQSIPDNIVGSPISPEALSGTLFIDEDGQAYMVSQGRSASGDQSMYEQDQFLGEERKEDLATTARRQQEELDRSKKKLEELKKQVEEMKEKVVEGEKKEDKKHVPEVMKDPESDSTSLIPEKKTDATKNIKRNAFKHG